MDQLIKRAPNAIKHARLKLALEGELIKSQHGEPRYKIRVQNGFLHPYRLFA